MKSKVWLHHLISAVFAFALSVSAVGNLITGYELPVDSVLPIIFWCAFFALVSSVLFRFRYGGWLGIFVIGILMSMLWLSESLWMELLQQVRSISYVISAHYHLVYDWPVLGEPAANDVSLPLILWAGLTAAGVNCHICRRKHIMIAVLPAVAPLVLCLLTTDRVPDAVYLYLLILGLAILFLSDWTRRRYPAQGTKLILRTALPVAVSLALLFVLNPREEYVNNAVKLQKELASRFQELQTTTESVVSGSPIASPVSEKLNLRTVGPKSKIAHSVMRVNAPVDGTLYLRGRDYDQYTGTGWEASSERTEEFTSGGASLGELSIVTYGVRNVLYVPYYPSGGINLVGGVCENDENVQRYSYNLSAAGAENSVTPGPRYTELPDDTLQWANELVTKITDRTTSDRAKITLIQNYVRSAAVYDLSTSRMDSDYNDFAQWFLEESETGYCVHFATAATVLLRAAGIPARYVEGYMITCSSGTNTVVSNQEAHAWAEYFDADSGVWRILEVTPPDPEEEETVPAPSMSESEPTNEEPQPETEDAVLEPSNPETIPADPYAETPEISEPTTERPAAQKKEPFRIPTWVKSTFVCLLFGACVPLQGHIRIYWKRKLWNHGEPNEQTMMRWKQTRSVAKLLKQEYPEELDDLAQKAKFSQHRIRPEELQQFEDYRMLLVAQVHDMPWYQRMLFNWILAID